MTLTKEKIQKNIIINYTFEGEKPVSILDWQIKELDKTDLRVKKELKNNGFIKTYSQEEVDKKMNIFINKI